MKTEISTYEQQAIDFLKSTNTEIKIEFNRKGRHFVSDKEDRDIYKVTLNKGNRTMSFEFGQSLRASGKYKVAEHLHNKVWCEEATGGKVSLNEIEHRIVAARYGFTHNFNKEVFKNPHHAVPTAYDILACLTKYDPGTFGDFCNEYGYDEDSIKANNIYKAVKSEYKDLCSLFNEEEMQKLTEIN